jgi:hypothetical protein
MNERKAPIQILHLDAGAHEDESRRRRTKYILSRSVPLFFFFKKSLAFVDLFLQASRKRF